MQNSYSKGDADKLIEYYTPLLKGKIIEESTGFKISEVIKMDAGDNKYTLHAVAIVTPNRYRRDLHKVVKELNLPAPNDALNNLNPHP